MKLSPIIIFVYNRLDHLQKLIISLKTNNNYNLVDLHIFSDGPKNDSEIIKIAGIRDFCYQIKGF
jgi:GT2 family glycosyltransferase